MGSTTFRVVASLVLLNACSGSDKKGTQDEPSTQLPAAPPVVTIVAKDFEYAAPDTISAGMVTLHLVNQGPELHHIQLLRFADGKTYEDFTEGLKSMKPDSPMPTWVRDVAGPNTPVPGGEASITEHLEPGDYAIICFIPGADQVPHAMKGMMKRLTVVPATGADAPPPVADIVVSMADYAWQVTPALTSGKHTIKLENAAGQAHEMVLALLEPGKSVGDLAAWVFNRQGPPPAKPLGGISAMSAGDVAYMSVDLQPGEYGLLCFVPDTKDGKPHVEHGMMKQFTVN